VARPVNTSAFFAANGHRYFLSTIAVSRAHLRIALYGQLDVADGAVKGKIEVTQNRLRDRFALEPVGSTRPNPHLLQRLRAKQGLWSCFAISVRPSERQNDYKHQRVRGNIQIEIRQAVQQDRGNAPEAGERDCSVILIATFPATPDRQS